MAAGLVLFALTLDRQHARGDRHQPVALRRERIGGLTHGDPGHPADRAGTAPARQRRHPDAPAPAPSARCGSSGSPRQAPRPLAGAALGALGLIWVLYERVLPFTGVLGFWLVLVRGLPGALRGDGRDCSGTARDVSQPGDGGRASPPAACSPAPSWSARSVTRWPGASRGQHLNFWTQSHGVRRAARSPLTSRRRACTPSSARWSRSPRHPALGAARRCRRPLFLAEVGGPLARPVRTIVEAMTALPDIIAGLFIYALFILTLGLQKSGLAAALALAVTMMPIITRASEVVLRLVPGTLREASYALGSEPVAHRVERGPAHRPVRPGHRGRARAWPAGSARPRRCCSWPGFTKEFNFNPFSGPQISLPLYIWNYVHIEADQRDHRHPRLRRRRRAGRPRARPVHHRPAARRRGARAS